MLNAFRAWPLWLILGLIILVIVLSIQGCPGPGIK